VNVGRAWKLQGDNSVDGREKEYMIEDQGLASGNSRGGASRAEGMKGAARRTVGRGGRGGW